MANTVINTPELLNLDSTTGATVLAKGTVNERPATPTFSVDYLVVAGGGGGGGGVTSESPGAGGAGAVIYQAAGLNVIPSSEYTLYIADGGTGGGNNSQGGTGQDSYISFNSSNIVLAKGGGGGGSYTGPGLNGGSGGGGTRDGDTNSSQSGGNAVTTNIAPAGASIYGNNGASGDGSCSGGGGGAGAVGTAPTGGDGVQINIDGNNYFWGGGGGACGSTGTGGQGGGGGGPRGGQGGTGGINPGASTGSSADGGGNGGANTGGGGGGATNPTSYPGGTGGSGIIILRYPNTQTITIGSGLTGTTATVGSEKVTTFTAGTGTISFLGTVVGGENEATDGALRFNTETNKTEYFDGTGWYEIVDEYASSFVGPGTNYFDTKLYTGNGSTQSIGGYINGSGSFNGSSSRITLPIGSPFNDSNTIKAVSAWVKAGTSTSRVYPLSISSTSNANDYWYIGYMGDLNRIYIQTRDGSSSNQSIAYATITPDTNWHHLVAQITATEKEIYLDGVKQTITNSNSGTGTNTSWISYPSYSGTVQGAIGVLRLASISYGQGSIDQVRIYDTALSSTDITALHGETAATASTAAFPPGQTAIATYTMDTSANGLLNTQDLSTVDYPSGAGCIALYEMNGNSNDTNNTYNGTPTNITYEGGAFDQAAVFNGSSSVITINSLFDFSSSFSISMWFNADALPSSTYAPLFFTDGYGGSGSDYGIALYLYGNTIKPWIDRQGTYTNIFTAGTLSAGTWYHVVLNRDYNSKWELFLNGSSLGTYTSAGLTDNYTPSSFSTIGKHANSNMWFDGKIDQVRIYNSAPTQSQVTTLARGIATSYSGAATNVNFNGHLDFQPDLVWIKSRNAVGSHIATDSVRGNGKEIYPDLTNAQGTVNRISLTSTGFDVVSAGYPNQTNNTFVAWNWKAGGAAVSNTDGTIASQVSANKDSGFSIVKFTGSLTSGQTVGHGLTEPPSFVILKDLDSVANWYIYHQGTGTTSGYINYLKFDSTAGSYSDKIFYPINFNSTTFTPGNDATVLQGNVIAYCFHSVAGYSKIGSYSGTGVAGHTIVTGFEPAWVIIKSTGVESWYIMDNKRLNGVYSDQLYANLSNAEGTGQHVDFTSNGFQLDTTDGGVNNGSASYIFMAFAAGPT